MPQNYIIHIEYFEIVISNFSNKKFIEDDYIIDFFKKIINLEKTTPSKKEFNVINPLKTFKKVSKLFKNINAGGGIVLNENDEVLLIKRLGFWDLPKGKQDKGENIKLTSLREVIEECGINVLALNKKVGNTYHCYFQKNKWYLKNSHWYLMNTWNQNKLTPQIEENITEVKWVNQKDIKSYFENMYPSIILILKKNFKL